MLNVCHGHGIPFNLVMLSRYWNHGCSCMGYGIYNKGCIFYTSSSQSSGTLTSGVSTPGAEGVGVEVRETWALVGR
jgi:hypothetical protein